MTEDARLLERRCRRLLLAYPRGYRQTTGQELLWVLLASAPAGRRWPTLADTADLIVHGLLERFRVWRQPEGSPRWRDGFAVFSVAAPAVMLVIGLIDTTRWATAGPVLGLYAALAAAALLGWRRTALALLGLSACYSLLVFGVLGGLPNGRSAEWPSGHFLLTFWVLEAVALGCATQPNRSELLTWRATAGLTVTGVLLGGLWWSDGVSYRLGWLAVLTAALAVLASSSRPGRWAAALFALFAWPYALIYPLAPLQGPVMLALIYLPQAAIAGVVAAAVLRARPRPTAGSLRLSGPGRLHR